MEDAVRVTLDEAGILQSFPSGFPWQGRSQTSKFLQVGNAVPPLLARRLLEAVVEDVRSDV